MPIDFDAETIEIASKLQKAEGYLDCEKIIIYNIKKQLDNSNNDENIISYLKKLNAWLAEKTVINRLTANSTNYRYAAGFVDTLLKMPYWKSWMQTFNS